MGCNISYLDSHGMRPSWQHAFAIYQSCEHRSTGHSRIYPVNDRSVRTCAVGFRRRVVFDALSRMNGKSEKALLHAHPSTVRAHALTPVTLHTPLHTTQHSFHPSTTIIHDQHHSYHHVCIARHAGITRIAACADTSSMFGTADAAHTRGTMTPCGGDSHADHTGGTWHMERRDTAATD